MVFVDNQNIKGGCFSIFKYAYYQPVRRRFNDFGLLDFVQKVPVGQIILGQAGVVNLLGYFVEQEPPGGHNLMVVLLKFFKIRDLLAIAPVHSA